MKKFIFDIKIILILSMVLKTIFFFYFADIRLDNEWGKLVHNLSISKTFGINVIRGDIALHAFALPGEKVLPSAFMPPLYAYFIYIVKLLSFNSSKLVNIIIILQIIISTLSVYFFYKILNNYCSYYFTFLISLIFSIIPINIIACLQISSITLQTFFLIIFIFFLMKNLKEKKITFIIFFSIISGLLILLRGEFIFFYFLSLLFLYFYNYDNLKKIILSLFVSLIIIFPYLYRNFYIFEEFVITKSFGYNLLKGNNPDFKIEGSDDFISKNYNQKDISIKLNNRYEINLDNFYKEKAIKYIKSDPQKYFKFYFQKIFSFLFFDLNSTYPNYYNLAHILPKIILSILSFFSAVFFLKSKDLFKFLSVFYFSNIIIFSLFFILPRYSVSLIPVQLLLISNFVQQNYIKKNFLK